MLTEERKEFLRKENQRKSHRQDNKQHCQKILEGIGNFSNNTAERAIWELMQNARDLSEHSHIHIELFDDKFIFSHDGKPFNYETFTSLIKQVSSEEKEDPNAAGQFGTGFMTTHKYSRKIIINGSMEIDKNVFVEIKDFVLDRTPETVPEMIESMSDQLEYADKLLEAETFPELIKKTSFKYELDNDHFPAAQKGVTAAFELTPYVMAFNDHIEEVRITDHCNNREIKFFKKECKKIDEECKLYKLTLGAEGESDRELFYLKSDDANDIIILPLESENKAITIDGIPRFFIYFPLLGTENIGFNYIFHSKRFFPEEPRNAIVLPEDNIDKRSKYESDEKVLNEMIDMLFVYLRKYISRINNSKLMAPVNINLESFEDKHQLTKDFYKRLKTTFVNEFLNLPFININGQSVSISQYDKVRFFSPEISEILRTEEGSKYLDVVYDYCCMVSAMPQKEDALIWSEIVSQWDSNETNRFITIDNIVDAIISKDGHITKLHDFLLFLKESNFTSYFSSKALIPNREGVRKLSGELRNAIDIPDTLYDVCKVLIPSETSKFVDNEFVDIYDLSTYNRNDLKKSINDYVNSEKDSKTPFKDTLSALISYCSIFPVINGKSIRNNAMPYICELFKVKYNEQYVAPLDGIESDTEQNLYRTAFDVLVDFSLSYIENESTKDCNWFENNKELHYKLLESLCNRERTTGFQQKMFSEHAIIPNQNGVFAKKEDLNTVVGRNLINPEILEKLFDIYEKIFKTSYRDKLINEKYAWMVLVNEVEPKKIGSEIDEELKESQYSNPITIEIIDLLDHDSENGYWRKWFNNIDINKPNIFLNRLLGEERTNTYKFMKTSPDKKAQIAELIDNPDFEEIVIRAKEIIRHEHERKIEFDHMLRIGKIIEDKLRNYLQDSLFKIEYCQFDKDINIADIQNGQDIIISYKGKEIFYIEVKSKWNFAQPAHMSTNQMRQAVIHPDNYALCCVDLTSYNANDIDTITDTDIIENTYIHLNIGYVLGTFLDNIVKDKSNPDENLKISDYQSNINKGFFKKGEQGIEPLIDAIVTRCKMI